MHFTKHFKIELSQPEVDFVDIDLDRDTPLFIDPYSISVREDDWSTQCREQIVSFFQTVIDHIRSGEPERAHAVLNRLTEPNETHLGLSRSAPRGRGVSGKQAFDLYERLSKSRAAQSGILTEIAECDLFVQGIGRDKISDMTTNIVRRLLIEYTQAQCNFHGILLIGEVASGRLWDAAEQQWEDEYVGLPVVAGKKVILVPKYSVRYELDQLAGRFNVNRGQVGLLVCRNVVDAGLLLKRCRDTAKDGRGYILVLGDEDINQMLHSVAKGNRKAIDQYLERKFDALID